MSNATVEKRRAVLINTAYFALLLGALYLFIKYAFWTVAPFVFAFLLATLLQRPINFTAKKTHIKKSVVSVVAVLLIFAIIATAMGLTGATVVSEIKGLSSTLMDWLKRLPSYVKSLESSILNFAQKLPDGLQSTVEDTVKSVTDKILLSSEERAELAASRPAAGSSGFSFDLSLLKTPLSGVWSTAKQIPSVLVGILIFIIASCFMTSGYDRIVGFIKNQLSPQKRRTLSRTKQIVFSSVGKLVKSYILIMLITFVEMFVGLYALKLIGVYKSEYIFIIAVITAIVDILPILGTGTVLIPWAVFSFLTGSYGLGIGLLVIYACISVIRQIIEPKIVANNLGIPPIVSIMGMYIGLQLFGFIGIFLVPILVTVLKVLNDDGVIHIWRSSKKKEQKKAESTNDSESAAQSDTSN